MFLLLAWIKADRVTVLYLKILEMMEFPHSFQGLELSCRQNEHCKNRGVELGVWDCAQAPFPDLRNVQRQFKLQEGSQFWT